MQPHQYPDHVDLAELFAWNKKHAVDMRNHVDTLARLGHGKDVAEIGFRSGVSAAAFLHGGCRKLTSFDIAECVIPPAIAADQRFAFVRGDSSCVEPTSCDVLLIDGDHSYKGCLSDLRRWSPHTAERIILHDTECRKLPGVSKALLVFLNGSDWEIESHFPAYPGLTIIKRRNA